MTVLAGESTMAVLQFIVALAAAIAGVFYMGRGVWRGFRAVQRVHELITVELTDGGGGGSLKDDVAATAVALGHLQRDVGELTRTKDLAHDLLQLQLDTVTEALGLPRYLATHKREEGQHVPSNPSRAPHG